MKNESFPGCLLDLSEKKSFLDVEASAFLGIPMRCSRESRNPHRNARLLYFMVPLLHLLDHKGAKIGLYKVMDHTLTSRRSVSGAIHDTLTLKVLAILVHSRREYLQSGIG